MFAKAGRRVYVTFIYPGVKVTESIDVERQGWMQLLLICVTYSLPNENGWRDSRRPDRKMDEDAAAPLID